MKKIVLMMAVFVAALPVFAQKQLTIDEAIKIALQKNPSLIKMKNSLTVNESGLKAAYGDLLPNLGASASWNWSRTEDKGIAVRDYLGNTIATTAQTSENRYYNMQIGGNVTLFDGLANIANISQKKDELKSAGYSIDKQKQTIVFQTANLFYLVLNAEELMRVREENVKYFTKFYESVNERNKLGSVAIADVYTAQVQLGNAELSLIQAQNQFETAKSEFLNYLALNVLEDYTFVDPFANEKTIDSDSYLKKFDDIQTLVKSAIENRNDFKSQLLSVNSAESGVTIAKSGIYPSLSGNYGFSTGAAETKSLFDRKSFSVGLTLQVPIFSNFRTENQIQYAKVNLMNAQEDLSNLERQVRIEVKQGHLDLVAAKKSLEVALKNVIAAEETRKINQERYNLGSSTILEVLQANRDYIDALRNKINTVYDFYRQYDKLNNALGRLDFSKYE